VDAGIEEAGLRLRRWRVAVYRPPPVRLLNPDVFAAGTLGALTLFEGHGLSFTQLVEAGALARRVVEEVFVAVIRENEPEALVADESLDRSVHRCCHSRFSKKEG
jgi:hypothetical protein